MAMIGGNPPLSNPPMRTGNREPTPRPNIPSVSSRTLAWKKALFPSVLFRFALGKRVTSVRPPTPTACRKKYGWKWVGNAWPWLCCFSRGLASLRPGDSPDELWDYRQDAKAHRTGHSPFRSSFRCLPKQRDPHCSDLLICIQHVVRFNLLQPRQLLQRRLGRAKPKPLPAQPLRVPPDLQHLR
jgi:hypothetical protein